MCVLKTPKPRIQESTKIANHKLKVIHSIWADVLVLCTCDYMHVQGYWFQVLKKHIILQFMESKVPYFTNIILNYYLLLQVRGEC